MSYTKDLYSKAELFVKAYFIDHLPAQRLYHNFEHAEEVAQVCLKLGEDAGLEADMLDSLLLAGWFHDTGYASNNNQIGEGSVEILEAFAGEVKLKNEDIADAAALIRQLHSRQEPQSVMEKILHDANRAYFGRKRFFRRSDLLRIEKERTGGMQYSLEEWNDHLLDMIVQHKFYTTWAHEAYTSRLNKNIAEQRDNIRDARKVTRRVKTGKDFGRGVDTLYRTTLRNHINLSRIADGKANMIISINTLVLSILITAGAAGISTQILDFTTHTLYLIPIITLMLTALLAIVFAVLSALPNISKSRISMEDIKDHKASMLFFGNFLNMSKAAFVEHLRELKTDQELLYDDLSRDLYNLGLVLRKKYRLLTLSYRIFLGGLVLSFLFFILCLIIV